MRNRAISTSTSFAMTVGGLSVLLECDSLELSSQLINRYREFHQNGETNFRARVLVGEAFHSVLPQNLSIKFNEGVVRIDSPGYKGFIDSNLVEGELILNTTYQLEGIDYFLRLIFILLAYQKDGLFLHSAGIVRQEKAFLFFGHSGCGKTTIAKLSSFDHVLNDDLVLLLPEPDRWIAFGTPFWNPGQVKPSNQYAPITGLFRLVHDNRNYLECVSRANAIAELVSNVPVIPQDPARITGLLNRLNQLLDRYPVYRLHFLPESSFWKVVEGFSKEESLNHGS